MVNLSDDQSSVYQLRHPGRVADASHSLYGAGNRNPRTLNDISRQNSRNVTVSGGRRVSLVSLRDDTITIDATSSHDISEKPAVASPPPAPPPNEDVQGEKSSSIEPTEKPNVFIRFYGVCKAILLASWINTLLVFVPVGIAVEIAGVSPTIVFAMNAIAIIPLAGLLSYATESVASEMGDTIGALMNVTFGNAVELIIFIALVKERSHSQITHLHSFEFSGNGTAAEQHKLTDRQTAFHASFTDNGIADQAVLKISRGTSVILLLVYVLYLLFQLKSHAYMYQSTPQHVIDEESHPGVLADMLHSSSSSSSSRSSSDSDSDGSSKSHTTAKRIRRVLRGRRRRKSSASSKDTPSAPSVLRTPSASTFDHGMENVESVVSGNQDASSDLVSHHLGMIASGDEADTDGESRNPSQKHPDRTVKSRDFEKGKRVAVSKPVKLSLEKKSKKANRQRESNSEKQTEAQRLELSTNNEDVVPDLVAQNIAGMSLSLEESFRRPFGKRGISNVLPAMPTMPRVLSTTVFSAANPTGLPNLGPPVTSAATSPLHRSTSLPSRLNRLDGAGLMMAEPQTVPYVRPVTAMNPTFDTKGSDSAKKHLSRTSAVLLLLASTGLVAVCAEFLVGSINYLVDNTGVSEAFIGLIVLPIVGNAAEHVTAVTVASKNKMDLAIGVAVGSSIQIALFVTPVVVLLGWALQKDMSLYFSLFETISLFVSAFIINFLILDGKTNYLEGALLIAAYVIIALAAFFYPKGSQQSTLGGADDPARMLLRML
ncbi:MAG: hypothetical protein Q9170_006487 [Blastenia crenularia]